MQTEMNSIEPRMDVRFRCPHCQKLYGTTADVFEDSTATFDCQKCEKPFRLLSHMNSFGLYQTEAVRETQLKPCPKCQSLKPFDKDECPICGVLESKFLEMQKSESPVLFELNQIWQKVLADFTRAESHQTFINACHQKAALNFAFAKYAEMKSTLGQDLTCEHYMNQVRLRLNEQMKAEEAQYYKSVTRRWLSPQQTVFLTVGVSGLGLLIFNKIKPTFPNLTGLVVAITLLAFGFFVYSADNKDIKL